MTYKETAAVVYRIVSAYPSQARLIEKDMLEDMIREWHQSLKHIQTEGVMEAVTLLITEQKWMPTLAEVIGKILDVQYGTDDDIIRNLDRVIANSSVYIIFGQVTEEQVQGYERLSAFQKLIVRSPSEFNLWLTRDHEWKQDRVNGVKRDIQYGRHMDYLNGKAQAAIGGFNVFKALEERSRGNDGIETDYRSHT